MEHSNNHSVNAEDVVQHRDPTPTNLNLVNGNVNSTVTTSLINCDEDVSTENNSDDQCLILSRLAQIRDYKRQVLEMMDQMKQESPNAIDKETLRKLITAYDNFKSQEEEYMHLLQIILMKKQQISAEMYGESSNNEFELPLNVARNGIDVQASSNLLNNMSKQQESLRALIGQIEAKSNGIDVPETAEQDLMVVQETVESQANALAAKRFELQALKERLSLVNSLSEQRSDLEQNLENVEKSADQTQMQNQLANLADKKRLMDQIVNTLAEIENENDTQPTAMTTARTDNVADLDVPEPPPPPTNETNESTEIRSSLEQKYNELIATKKRIAEIQSLMSALQQKSNTMLMNDPLPPNESLDGARIASSSRMNNSNVTEVKNSNSLLKSKKSEDDKECLLEIRRQLLSMNDDQLSTIANRRANEANGEAIVAFQATKSQKLSNQRQMLNNVKDSMADFMPCRIPKTSATNNASLIDDVTQDTTEEYGFVPIDEMDALDNFGATEMLSLNRQAAPLVPNISINPRLVNFRRNNDIVAPVPQNNTGGRLNNSHPVSARKYNANNNMFNNPLNNGDVNLLNSSNSCDQSSQQDNRYDQLTQHIESIRSIFESIMMTSPTNDNSRLPLAQNRVMTSSLPNGNPGNLNPLMTSSLMSNSSVAAAILGEQEASCQQKLAINLLQCQQQLQAQQQELIKLHRMYQQLANVQYGAGNGAMVNSVDGRPLSRNSLFNLLAPNQYLPSQYESNIYQQPVINRGVSRSVSGDFHQYGQTTERQGRFRSVESTIRRDGGHKRRSASILSDSRAINHVPSCFGDEPFDGLRESIYSEVATLISQNEQRPHYLLELFRELQLLSSDHLRSRAFRAIRDILNRYLVEENETPIDHDTSRRIGELVREMSQSNNSGVTSDDEFNTGKHQRITTRSSARSVDRESGMIRRQMIPSKGIYTRSANMSTVSSTPSRSFQTRNFHNATNQSISNNENFTLNDIEPRLNKICIDLRSFLVENDPVAVCSAQFLNFARKFTMALVVSSKLIPVTGEGAFVHKKLATTLQQILARFSGRRLTDCHDQIVIAIMSLIKEQGDFYNVMQNIDNAIEEATSMSSAAASMSLNRSSNDHGVGQLFSVAGNNLVRSPSEIGDVLQLYNEEIGSVDNALAFIDDEMRVSAFEQEALLQNGNETPIADKYGQRSNMQKYRDER